MKKHRTAILFVAGFAAMLTAGWVGLPAVLYKKVEQPLGFNHKVHGDKDKAGMACQDCHSFREDGSFVGVPVVESCGTCHAEPMGDTPEEKRLVENFVKQNREPGWLVYARQPINVSFSHAVHVQRAKLDCKQCHGDQGSTASLRPYEENRISGYSRDIWGRSISRVNNRPGEGMKMTDCESCHHERGVEAGCLGCHQ